MGAMGNGSLSSDIAAYTQALGRPPTEGIRKIELQLPRLATRTALDSYLFDNRLSLATLRSAVNIKSAIGQIDVVIHALGILTSLPHVLVKGEKVLSTSLGAGNRGFADFDLETNLRVAEFKFIRWRGGPEPVRKQQLLKDYLKLLWDPTPRMKQLYLTDTTHATAFLRGRTSMQSALRKSGLLENFRNKYGEQFQTVGQLFTFHAGEVEILDLCAIVPGMSAIFLADDAAAPEEQ
ncbi:MAG: hypothetical protein JW846_09485 [Dehalococcoidia bacterium]|nr:hypothetical protein [Dehalococcoidia bacterium]